MACHENYLPNVIFVSLEGMEQKWLVMRITFQM